MVSWIDDGNSLLPKAESGGTENNSFDNDNSVNGVSENTLRMARRLSFDEYSRSLIKNPKET